MCEKKHLDAIVLLSSNENSNLALTFMLEQILKVNPQLALILWEKGAILVNDFEVINEFTHSEEIKPIVIYDFDLIYPVLQNMNYGI